MKRSAVLLSALVLAGCPAAFASSFTITSPTGGALPPAVSPVGGVVTDLTGKNGVRVVAQVAASTEFVGYENQLASNTGYLTFARQTGISPSVIAALGGGISAASFRVTLFDGDTQAGDFDFNQNFLYIGGSDTPVGTEALSSNGVNFGNLSDGTTQQTDGLGNAIGANTKGYGNELLDTGFFSTTNTTLLSSLYSSLVGISTGSKALNFQIRDNTYGDQYYDFTQGIDSSLVNVGSGPIVVSPTVTPEPSSILLMATGALFFGALLMRKSQRFAAFSSL